MRECQHFKQFIKSPEATWENRQRIGAHGKMHLAHGEVMEAKGQRRGGPGIGRLFMRQGDVEANGRRPAFGSAAIGRCHDSRPATRCNHIIPRRARCGERTAAHGDNSGEGARILIKAGTIQGLLRGAFFCCPARLLGQRRGFFGAWGAGGTKHHDG